MANVAIQYSVEDVLAADQGTEQATHRKTLPSATASLALAQGPRYPTKLLASVTCGSLSSEREFPVTAPLGFWTPTAAAYFYSHYNLAAVRTHNLSQCLSVLHFATVLSRINSQCLTMSAAAVINRKLRTAAVASDKELRCALTISHNVSLYCISLPFCLRINSQCLWVNRREQRARPEF
jgi:hypothetical protein